MRIAPLLTALVLSVAPVGAHEFWISPQAYTIAPQDQLVADLRVGELFKGGAYAYLPSRFVRFDMVQDGRVMAVEGRVGDRPALANDAPGDGLVTVVHQTGNSLLTYREWEKFENFARHKDAEWALDGHRARGLPDTGFREVYSRYGKSLIAVGSGAGVDAQVGLLTEIVALANPYTDALEDGLPVRVLYQDAPRRDTQVEMFERAPDGSVSVSLHRTDGDGVAVLPVQPGHEYLVDAVVIRSVEPQGERDPVWESLWASLTFKVPEG